MNMTTSFLLSDSMVSSAPNVCFYLFYCKLKEKDHKGRKLNSKKIVLCEMYYFDLPKIRAGWPHTTKN